MSPVTQRPPSRPWMVPFALWALVFIGLLASAGRHAIEGDATQTCGVAQALWKGNLGTTTRLRADMVLGPNGRWQSKYPLLSVLQCASALPAQHLGRSLGGPDSPGEHLGAAVVPAGVGGLVALGFFLLARTLGFARGRSAVVSLLLVFSTHLWAYGRTLYGEGLQAAAMVWFLYVWVRVSRTPSRGGFLLGGTITGLAFHTKTVFLFLPAVALAHFLMARPSRRRLGEFLVFTGLGALPFALAWLAYNHARYGSLLATGYSHGRDGLLGFSAPLLSGLHGLLLSPGKSLFLYAPLTLLAAPGLWRLWRQDRRLLLLTVAPTVVVLLVVACWWSGLGDWGWGPRLLVPALPCLFVPVLYTLKSRRFGSAVQALAGLGLLVNVLGVTVHHSHYLSLVHRHTTSGLASSERDLAAVRDDLVVAHFVPEFSPPMGHAWLLYRYASSKPWQGGDWYPWQSLNVPAWEIGPEDDPIPRSLNSFMDGSGLARAVWLALVAALLVLARYLVGASRRIQGSGGRASVNRGRA